MRNIFDILNRPETSAKRQARLRRELHQTLQRSIKDNLKAKKIITIPPNRFKKNFQSTSVEKSRRRHRTAIATLITACIVGGVVGYQSYHNHTVEFVRPQVALASPLAETSFQYSIPSSNPDIASQYIFPQNTSPNMVTSDTVDTDIETQHYINPLLFRIVDQQHPITEEEMKTQVEPGLVKIIDYIKNIYLINSNARINQICIDDFSQLATSAQSDGIKLTVRDSFRDYYGQQQAYNQAPLKTVVTLPGYSQHHTGLAIDFTTPEIGNIVDINSGFANTATGKWLDQNAWKYGFVQSYTNGHDGIKNEPWHYLYVGREIAKDWYDSRQINPDIDIFQILQKYN